MKVHPDKLTPHPFNALIYGDEAVDPEFLASIREQGILEAVVVVSTSINGAPGLYILSGHRRTQAAKLLGIEVPIRPVADEGPMWQELYLLEVNKQRVKTPGQKAREFTELKRIELKRAEQRRAAGIREKGTASATVATILGISESWARQMEVVVKEADAGNPLAVAGLKDINQGKTKPGIILRALVPREVDTSDAHYHNIAAELQDEVGIFSVMYAPRAADPKHGYVFKVRFVCEEEARAFIALVAKVPAPARNEFARLSKSWHK